MSYMVGLRMTHGYLYLYVGAFEYTLNREIEQRGSGLEC